MRKSALFTLLLFFFSVGGVCATASNIYKQHDQVIYEETIITGDRVEANGLEVQIYDSYKNQLFWDSTLRLTDPLSTSTDYKFEAVKQYENYRHEYSGIFMDAYPDQQYDPQNPDQELTGIALAYKELYDSLEPDVEGVKVITLKDYMDYYPISVSLDFPGFAISSWDYDSATLPWDGSSENHKTLSILQDYFKIPLLETEKLEIRLTKDAEGYIHSSGSGIVSNKEDYFSLYTFSTLSEDACYFTFDAHTANGNLVDLSELPKGYGIYKLPYSTSKNENGIPTSKVDIFSLDMVFELNPEAQIRLFDINPITNEFLLFTYENDVLVLTTIDIETMTVTQRLDLPEWQNENGYANISFSEDYNTILLMSYNDKLAVLSKNASENLYELHFVCDTDTDLYNTYQINDFGFSYNGNTLALGTLIWHDYGLYTGDFYLATYDHTGLTYLGKYETSLNTGHIVDEYYYPCQTYKRDGIRVDWK